MTTVSQIQTKLDTLAESTATERAEWLALLQGFKTEIQALKDQIGSGGVATQADLDVIGERLDTEIAKVQSIIDSADTA